MWARLNPLQARVSRLRYCSPLNCRCKFSAAQRLLTILPNLGIGPATSTSSL